ncbi:hypothetical protein OF83DRAFT_1179883 [Amylostereum chailletii]|nr:hypothetical protein OF83DRAFT_1179883 [Amylostereum chailletii]
MPIPSRTSVQKADHNLVTTISHHPVLQSAKHAASATERVDAGTVKPAKNHQIAFFYPLTGAGTIPVMMSDIDRLKPGQCLNDTLVKFGLRLFHADKESTDADIAARILTISPFFYEKLSSASLDRSRVPKFGLNIFQKKHLIIPIHDSTVGHWYLAIITMPTSLSAQARVIQQAGQEANAIHETLDIFIFDSLGHHRTSTIEKLHYYVASEAQGTALNPVPVSLPLRSVLLTKPRHMIVASTFSTSQELS